MVWRPVGESKARNKKSTFARQKFSNHISTPQGVINTIKWWAKMRDCDKKLLYSLFNSPWDRRIWDFDFLQIGEYAFNCISEFVVNFMLHDCFVFYICFSEEDEQLLKILKSCFCFGLRWKQALKTNKLSFDRFLLLCHITYIFKKNLNWISPLSSSTSHLHLSTQKKDNFNLPISTTYL